MKFPLALVMLLFCSCYEVTYVQSRRDDYARESALTASQIRSMLEAGVSEEVIRQNASRAGMEKLSSNDLVALKQAGASDGLLQELIARERKEPQPDYRTYRTYQTPAYYSYYDSPSFYYHSYPSYGYGSYGYGGYGYGGYRRSDCSPGSRVRFGW